MNFLKITFPFCLLLVLIGQFTYGQIEGVYQGKVQDTRIVEFDSAPIVTKQLTLNRDSSFAFWREYTGSSASTNCYWDTIWVTGTWTNNTDTIVLNSKYNATDFVGINDFYSGLNTAVIIYNTRFFCHDSDLLIINDSISFEIYCGSVVLKDLPPIMNIKFVNYIGNVFLYDYSCTTGLYPVDLITININHLAPDGINKSFFKNEKFLLQKNMIHYLGENDLLKVEKGYKQIKSFK